MRRRTALLIVLVALSVGLWLFLGTRPARPPEGQSPGAGTSAGGAVHVPPSAPITIRVVDWNGEPVRSAKVDLQRMEENGMGSSDSRYVARVETDAAGLARIEGLDPAVGHLLVVDGPTRREDLVQFRTALDEWKPRDETIRLEHGYVVRGVVQDAAGQPIRGYVTWKTEQGSGHAYAGDGGRFVLLDVPYGPASVGAVAWAPGRVGMDVTRWFEVTPERPEVVVVPGPKDPPPIVLQVQQGTFGQPVLFLADDPARSSFEVIGADLTVALSGLDSTIAYTLWIPPSDAEADTSLLRRGWRVPSERAKVSLEMGLEIRGHLRGIPAGTDVSVVARALGDLAGRCRVDGRVDAAGAYRIRGVPAGMWQVFAVTKNKPGSSGQALSATADVEAGSAVDLELKSK